MLQDVWNYFIMLITFNFFRPTEEQEERVRKELEELKEKEDSFDLSEEDYHWTTG